jgi:hypothetical protein
MHNTLSKTAWATTLAVGGLLLVGTAAARADDTKSGDHRHGDRTARAAARRDSDSQDHQPIRTRASGRGRMQAGRGEHGRSGREFAHATHERSRGNRDQGRWAHGEGRGGRASTHHRVSMHWKHARRGQHWGRHAQSSHSGRSHASARRNRGRGESRSSVHGRAWDSKRADDRSSSRRDS